MRIKMETEYALRCICFLAEQQYFVCAAEISEQMDIPTQVAARVLSRLCRSGILEARTGQRGGHRLARPANQITFYDILASVGDLPELQRAQHREALPESVCALVGHADARMLQLQQEIERRLRKITLSQLVKAKARQG